MKRKNLQPRLLYPARISYRFDGEIKTGTGKQKLREYSTTKPALQQILKEQKNKRLNSQVQRTSQWLPEAGCGALVKWVKKTKRYKLPVKNK